VHSALELCGLCALQIYLLTYLPDEFDKTPKLAKELVCTNYRSLMSNKLCTLYNTRTQAKHSITYCKIENVDVNIKLSVLQQFNEL